jgi:Flp pilus assembly pilin Flp
MQSLVVQLVCLAETHARLAWRGRGQSTVEYALIGALIVVIASVAIGMLGTQVTTVFEQMASALKGGK